MYQYEPCNEEELVFLNNFFCHFPFGDKPYVHLMPLGSYRTNLKGYWGISLRDLLKSTLDKIKKSEFEQYLSSRSDRRLAETPAQFYAEVDATVVRLGMSLNEVSERINQFLHDSKQISSTNWEEGMRLHQEIDAYLAPIYKALRDSGYSRQDLFG